MIDDVDYRSLKAIFNAFFHEKYTFEKFLGLDISKEYEVSSLKNGRLIFRPSNILKDFHIFIYKVVLEKIDVDSDSVFSYRKGVNVRDAVLVHSKSKYFFQTDIKDFFSSINEENVRSILNRSSNKIPIKNFDDYIETFLKYIVIDGKLPVGFSTSPIISNAFLYEFDLSVKEFCSNNGLKYSRYSDDLIFSGQDKEIVYSINETVSNFLSFLCGNSFFINDKKTKRKSLAGKAAFLGLKISSYGEVTVESSFKKEVEIMLHFFVNDKDKFSDYCGGYEKGISLLQGKVNYIYSVDRAYFAKLKRKFGNTVLDIVLRRELD